MYTSHFQFDAKPFQISANPKFLWLGEQHKEALAILRYGIQENKGVIALSGGVGTGKTTLINALMHRIKDDVIAAVVSNPSLEPNDFFYYIANLFGMKSGVDGKADFLIHFIAFLKQASRQKKKVLLIIDEAQRLDATLLEEIRLLSNIEHSGKRLLNVFLVGQNEMNAMLLKPVNRGLKQRVAINFNIVPLTLDEVRLYIDHRLKVAGCDRRIFTDGAIKEIYVFSKGYPRLINTICDQSLISAFVENSPKVTAEMVAGSAKEFQFPVQAPSHPPISNDGVPTRIRKTIARYFVRSHHQKRKKQNPSKNEHVFSSFQWTYLGLILMLSIFSGYLLYQYTMGSTRSGPAPIKDDGQSPPSAAIGENSPLEKIHLGLPPSHRADAFRIPGQRGDEKTENEPATPRHKNAPPAYPPKKPVMQNAVTDAQPMIEENGGGSSEFAGRTIMPTESPPTPSLKKAEEKPNIHTAAPSKDKTDPGVISSNGNRSDALLAADAPPPPLSNDKDPGAIIEWLIRNKK